MKEIEHKYLVISDAYKALSTEHKEISQGYLCTDPERTVRVRIYGSEGYITIKGKTIGDTRAEYEYPIPTEDARRLLEMCAVPPLSKTRWIVPYEGFIWEVDEFHGDLAPLVMAEIELPSSETTYPLPAFVGENVTGNPEYYNSSLAKRIQAKTQM